MKNFQKTIQTNPDKTTTFNHDFTKSAETINISSSKGKFVHKTSPVINFDHRQIGTIIQQQYFLNHLDNLNLMKNSNDTKKQINSNPKKNILQYKENVSHINNTNFTTKNNQQNQSINLCQANVKSNYQKIISKALKGKQLEQATKYQHSLIKKQRKRIFPLLIKSGEKLLNYQETLVSSKAIGNIISFAANTNKGTTRFYNQDRVTIVLNMSKGNIKFSYFAIYDGHGGKACCEYLRLRLHQNILNNKKFPENIKESIFQGIKNTQEEFMQLIKQEYQKNKQFDKSGSCAIIALIVQNWIYIINIGDSRAILSAQNGKFTYNLSRDHKPSDIFQQKRISEAGGIIYRSQLYSNDQNQEVYGPLRVYPGKLSVSRTFGDFEAKFSDLGGNDKVVIAYPEIKYFQLEQNHDFIILGSDGIYDKLDSRDIVQLVWATCDQYRGKQANLHDICKECVEQIIREAMNRRSTDNITIVMITFKSFEKKIKEILQETIDVVSNSNLWKQTK